MRIKRIHLNVLSFVFSIGLPHFYSITDFYCYQCQLSFFFFFLRPNPQHMEVPRLQAELKLQLPAYATATAMRDLSCIFDLCHSLWQCRILNPLSEARDRTHILMDTSRVLKPLRQNGNTYVYFIFIS